MAVLYVYEIGGDLAGPCVQKYDFFDRASRVRLFLPEMATYSLTESISN
jgi:hypothetical protein